MATNRRGWQGGFILVTVIFLILIGVLLLAGMAFLYGTADTQQSLQNTGAQAFISAESGDQYGVYWLETNYSTTPLNVQTNVTPPLDNPECPATVTIFKPTKVGNVYTYTVQSVVSGCISSGASRTVTRTVTATQKGGGVGPGGGGVGPGGGGVGPGGVLTYQTMSWIEK